ncbi:hypothetical protein EI94DRAFT_1704558 [Lactarius quietus]|nr:hypothetical protein EI94DRAFT_1704558 [Lactarius quietus]
MFAISSDARPKPLSNVLPELLSHQSHPMHAKWTQCGQQIEEPRQDLDIRLEEISVATLAAAATVASTCSRSRTNSGGQCAAGFLDDVWDDKSALLPTGVMAVTVKDIKVQKEAAHLEFTDPLLESIMVGVLHDKEPNGVGALVGGGITVKEVAHCLVEMAFTVFAAVSRADDLPLGKLEGGGIVLIRWGRDRSMAEALKVC